TRARKIIAVACTGASIPVCATAGGVTPNTLKSWLRRKDHEAFLIFQRYFDEAVTYATLAALKAIMEGVASDPKHAFEFLARRERVRRDRARLAPPGQGRHRRVPGAPGARSLHPDPHAHRAG